MNANAPPIIPHSRPTHTEADVEAVAEVVRSGYVAQGEKVAFFERMLADMVGVKNAAAVSSGTAALHLTLMALGIGPEDEVIMPSFVCTALLNAVGLVGASPVIADIDPATFNIDPGDAGRRITERTKAVIVPHVFGKMCDINEFKSLGVAIIEDCAQSLGASFGNRGAGSSGDVAIFSFYATKVISTGEGGMVVANGGEIINNIKDIRDYDNKADHRQRLNCKMTDMQAALGISQLSSLKRFVQDRRNVAARYSREFNTLGIELPDFSGGHIFYRYVVRIPPRTDVSLFIDRCRENGVVCARPVYRTLHQCIKINETYPWAEDSWNRCVSIPIYPSLNEAEITRIIETIKTVAYGA